MRRTGNGFDFRRLLLLTAVLSKQSQAAAGAKADIFVNIVGGLTLTEPAADLAVSMAIASAALGKPSLPMWPCWGGGYLVKCGQWARSSDASRRAARLGFRTCLVPRSYGTSLAPLARWSWRRFVREAMHVLELR